MNTYFQFLNNNPNYLVIDSPNVFIPLLGIKNNTIGIFFSKEQFWVPNFHDMLYKDVHRIHVEYSKEVDYDKEIVGYDESNFFDKELYYTDDYEELEKNLTPFDTSVPPVLDDSFKLESSIDTTGVTKISFVVEPDYEFDTSSYKEILLNQLGEETFTKNGTITLNEIDEKYNIPLIKISPKDIEELFDIKIFLYTSCGYIEMSSSNGIIYNYPYLYYNDQFYPLEFNMRAYRYGVGPYSFAISGDKSSFKLYTLISNFNYYLYTMLTSFDSNTKELKEFNYLEIFNDYYNRKIERTDAGQDYPTLNYIPLLAVKNNVIGIYYSKELVDMQNMCITNEYVGKIRTDYCLEADLEKGINFDEGNFFEINPFELYKYFLINNDIEPFI